MPNRFALLIGINDYESRAIPALRFAESDATELAGLLNRRCGFQTQCLTGTAATRKAILEALQAGGRANNWPRLEPGDQFLFFFAGHGELIDRSYFIHPYDAQAARSINSIQVRDLIQGIEPNLDSIECMCIFDACRNLPKPGARGGTATMDAGVTRDIRAICDDSARHIEILFGCGEGEQSHEDPQLEHGILTYHLQKVLETPELAATGLTFDELANRSGTLIGRWVLANPRGIRQRPQLERPTSDRKILLIPPVLADGGGGGRALAPAAAAPAGANPGGGIPQCNWVYFATSARAGQDNTYALVEQEKVICRTAFNAAGALIPHVGNLRGGHTILLAYGEDGVYHALCTCRITQPEVPLQVGEHLLQAMTRADPRLAGILANIRYRQDQFANAFTVIPVVLLADLRGQGLQIARPGHNTLWRWENVFPG